MMKTYERYYQFYLDKSITWPATRWCGFAVALIIFIARVLFGQGWYISAYAFAIFLLNLFIGFLSPRQDPDTHAYILPIGGADDEFRPFQRKIPEFEFWHRGSIALFLSLLSTTSRIFDLPVYWPVLLVYFLFIFFLAMRNQIMDMIKHRYLPFSRRKQRYGDVSQNSPLKSKRAEF